MDMLPVSHPINPLKGLADPVMKLHGYERDLCEALLTGPYGMCRPADPGIKPFHTLIISIVGGRGHTRSSAPAS